MELSYVEKHTIFECVIGSQAYGISTPESDVDKSGVMIPGKEYFYGLKRFEQFQGYAGEDKTVYNIKKAIALIAENNPNMLDLIFIPERCILKITPYWQRVLDNAHLFISKKCKFTFSGYAISQLNRIKTHREYLKNPPKGKPERSDYGLGETCLFETAQLKSLVHIESLYDFIQEENKEPFLNQLDSIYGDQIVPLFAKYLREDRRTIALEFLQGALQSQLKTLISMGQNHYIKDEYVDQAERELKYINALRNWQRYEEWKKHRNKKRAPLEEKFGYDCYSDDTEFLTDSGWKKYDFIFRNDKLATIKVDNLPYRFNATKRNCYIKPFEMEYQNFLERFEGLYSGVMYNLIGNHIDSLVTPNHRLLFRSVEKNTAVEGPWVLEEASLLPNSFDFLKVIKSKNKLYENPIQLKDLPIKDTQFMALMGWYLSDGCILKNGAKVKSIRISQKKGGRLHWHMSRFYSSVKNRMTCGLYIYNRKPNDLSPKDIEEVVLNITDKIIREKIYRECGDLKNKRIPRWVFTLSKRLKEFLFDALILGDGTVRNTSLKSLIYYTTLKGLADDVQELALSCGWETSLYGPYKQIKEIGNKKKEIDMYQIHVNKNVTQFHRLCRSKDINKVDVKDLRIVCFSVPNRTLITRRNGQISFHGNSKHAAHLIRLLRMGKEILMTGKVNVDRTAIDAEELKAIRNGSMSYDEIEQYASDSGKELDSLYATSTLQKAPQIEKIDALCVDICDEYFKAEKSA